MCYKLEMFQTFLFAFVFFPSGELGLLNSVANLSFALQYQYVYMEHMASPVKVVRDVQHLFLIFYYEKQRLFNPKKQDHPIHGTV